MRKLISKHIRLILESEDHDPFYRYLIELLEVKKLGSELISNIVNDIKSTVKQLSIKNLKWDDLNAFGMASHDTLYLLTDQSVPTIVFAIFHELAHFYQYRKYGKNMALSIYKDEKSIDELYNDLMKIENVADRFAEKKIKKYGLKGFNYGLMYKNNPPRKVKDMITTFRGLVKSNKLNTIDEINNWIFNYIKISKPS